MKIGLVYVKGAVPAFEDFGFLPTHLVKGNGLVKGERAHKVLDGLIIPGGSIMESGSLTLELGEEIHRMNQEGKFILGICSGFQALAHKTDIGRRSPCPIIKKGLGILDVNFSPLISNDRVEATIVEESFLTRGLCGETITGFHCHTYGQLEGEGSTILKSEIKRVNYSDNPQEVVAGVKNLEGNVVGTMLHGSLDENPPLVKNILEFLGASEKQTQGIYNANKELLKKIKQEIGIETGLKRSKTTPEVMNQKKFQKDADRIPPTLMIASTGSDSGKTFISTGLGGAFYKKGLKVAILKVGPDIRDIVPALYLTKGKMEKYSSIKIGHLGWMELPATLENLKKDQFDLVIVEGVMGVFTGILNEKIPYSGAEIARGANIPVIMVSGCNKGGIETAAVDVASQVKLLQKMGIKVPGIILNRVYNQDIFNRVKKYIKKDTGVEQVMAMPKVKMKERGTTPEVEIKLEEFCISALKTVEEHLDLNQILIMAQNPEFRGYFTFRDIENFF
ncbi:MAG: AAA family ATPase [Euryarchaeota archaeon]|nr:AAA family ATPase [Euryarchaeota archaeon]MBU4547284.1 AAA family ATPase [Euryarchaeota archaeon]MBU4607216.1 AAA family ATPase [Euryarchaeota archaeon]MBV1755257.1 AAA family ATPase [Methanobacterium sp.]MBV1768103.1 AAA family ATPase [Methanobacterium sp.]